MHADTRAAIVLLDLLALTATPKHLAKEIAASAKMTEDGNTTVPTALPPAAASWLCRHLCLCCPAQHYFSLRCRGHPARQPVVACAAISTAATVGGDCSAGGFYARFVSIRVFLLQFHECGGQVRTRPRLRGVTGADIWPGDGSPPLLVTGGGGDRSPSCGRDRWPDMPPSISVGIDFEIGLSNKWRGTSCAEFSLESKEDTESQT